MTILQNIVQHHVTEGTVDRDLLRAELKDGVEQTDREDCIPELVALLVGLISAMNDVTAQRQLAHRRRMAENIEIARSERARQQRPPL
jgi:hypothetical protein